MFKVIDTVREILFTSPIAFESLHAGVLNLSSYADQIKPQVEAKTYKEVKKQTIVVALARIRKEIPRMEPLIPEVSLEELRVKGHLFDITYEKTEQNVRRARQLGIEALKYEDSFLTITEGINEITVIASFDLLKPIQTHFNQPAKALYEGLYGISIRFSQRYLTQPNVIYSILSALAVKRINLIEVVSTYTELTVIVDSADLEPTLQALQKVFIKTSEGKQAGKVLLETLIT